ncbi:MAG: ribonuclease HI family protein [Candidatus Hodarchaeales archaeon]|jgi:ribonuclease HI
MTPLTPKTEAKEEGISIFTDGASRQNPGPAAAAFVILQDDRILHEESHYLGVQTNNYAEYQAIIKGLEKASEYSSDNLIVYSDSELVIKQLNGDYRVNKPHLKSLRNDVYILISKFTNVRFIHVQRNHLWIKHVDKLCNQILNKNS